MRNPYLYVFLNKKKRKMETNKNCDDFFCRLT